MHREEHENRMAELDQRETDIESKEQILNDKEKGKKGRGYLNYLEYNDINLLTYQLQLYLMYNNVL